MDAICVSWNQALERLAPQYAGTVTRERLQPCMGMLLPDILNRLVPELDQEKMQPVLDQILAEENRYVAEYGGILFPGEEEVLASLSGRYRTAWGSTLPTSRTPAAPACPRRTTSPWWWSATA